MMHIKYIRLEPKICSSKLEEDLAEAFMVVAVFIAEDVTAAVAAIDKVRIQKLGIPEMST